MAAARVPRAAAVNVDVDSLYLYYQLHDLDPDAATNAVWERGIPRFLDLFDEVGVKATFFVVAADLERWETAREVAADAVARGHELGSHTWSHPYDLTRMDRPHIEAEIDRATEVLSDLQGRPVVGFRAPGYHMVPAIYDVLAERGYLYSSSIFPCPPYHLAKLAVMAGMRVTGKQTSAIAGDPRIMVAKTTPHRRRGLLEVPITVLPPLRLPFIGTSLLMGGQLGYSAQKPLMKMVRFVNLEFHGIDMCDLESDGIDPALLKQPDLRVPLADKTELFRRVLGDLQAGWGVDTLEKLAPSLAAAA